MSQPVHTPDASAAAVDLYSRLCDAMVAADTAAIDALLTAGCVLTHMTGYPQPKVEWMGDIQAGTMRYHHIEVVAVTTGTEGGFSVVRGRSRLQATIARRSGTWRLQMVGYVVPDSDPDTVHNPTGFRFSRLDASTW